jgi:hypothetical protein
VQEEVRNACHTRTRPIEHHTTVLGFAGSGACVDLQSGETACRPGFEHDRVSAGAP